LHLVQACTLRYVDTVGFYLATGGGIANDRVPMQVAVAWKHRTRVAMQCYDRHRATLGPSAGWQRPQATIRRKAPWASTFHSLLVDARMRPYIDSTWLAVAMQWDEFGVATSLSLPVAQVERVVDQCLTQASFVRSLTP
jgi:hypothetical protein